MTVEKKVIRIVVVIMLILSVLVCSVLLGVPNLHLLAMQRQLAYTTRVSEGESVLDLMQKETAAVLEAKEEMKMLGQLRLEIPSDVDSDDISVDNDYVDQTVLITIPGLGSSYFYDYPMIGSSDHIADIRFDVEKHQGIIDISLDSVYEVKTTVDGDYLYIDFVDPHEVYDKIIVIDAGHGGKDPGADISDVLEKDIDLAVVQKMKALFDVQESIGVYYTRLDDSNISLQKRVGLANALGADLFLSVHNNSTSSGRMSSINGTEVMYRVSDETGASKAFAENCLSYLLASLGSGSKGVVAGDDIYIIRTATMPVALAEIGFMTNAEELTLLQEDDYQQKAAQALYDAILTTLED